MMGLLDLFRLLVIDAVWTEANMRLMRLVCISYCDTMLYYTNITTLTIQI